jgi:hypothetical protein
VRWYVGEPKQVSKELQALFVDEGEQAVDGLLRITLEPLLGLTRDGRVVTKSPFLKLSLPSRILAVLLARRAMVRLDVPNVGAEASPEQLEDECVAPLKACRECLSRLKAKKVLEKNEAGYFIPLWAVSRAVEEIKGSS